MKTPSLKTLAFALGLSFILFVAGCSKNNGNNNNQLGNYFFIATFQGQTYNFNNQFFERDNNFGILGGFVPDSGLTQKGGIFIYNIDTTTKSKVLSLANTTYSFAPSASIKPVVDIFTGNIYSAMATADPNYNVKVSNIAFIRTENVYGNFDDVYAVSGTFKAKMIDTTGVFAGDANGSFNIQCTAPHF
jgi:hypothetical protein